jgi:hypothetical protein
VKLWKIATALLAALSPALAAQNTTVTATVVDSDNVTWVGGTWTMQFVPNGAQPSIKAYNINGVPLSPSVTTQTGSLDGTGALSAVVYQNGAVTPALSQWKLTVCPLATSQCGSYTFTAAGASMDVSSNLTALIPAPRFPSTAGSYGYSDIEVSPTPSVGGTYWNVISLTQRYWNGTIWIGGTNSHTLFLSAYSSLVAADAAAVAANFTICVDTNMSTTGNTTLNAKWAGCGGIITRGSNTLTFTQPINNGVSPLFDAAGTGLISYAAGQSVVNTAWYGVKADSGVTDNLNPLTQAGLSVAGSGTALHVNGGLGSSAGYIGFTGQLVFNNVNNIYGDGQQSTILGSTYTAGCSVVQQFSFNGNLEKLSIIGKAAQNTIPGASGYCPESVRRGGIGNIVVNGFYNDFDTSLAGASNTGLFQIRVYDSQFYCAGNYFMFLNPPATGTTSSNLFQNIRMDNNGCGGLIPAGFVNLTTASDNHFDGINYQNATISGPGFFMGSDAHDTHLDNQHIEANILKCAGGIPWNACGFYGTRGITSIKVGMITWQNNSLNTTNIPGGHYAIFTAETGGNFFDVGHILSEQNTLTGVVVPAFNFFESGALATGRARLTTFENNDGNLTVAALGNFATSVFGNYMLNNPTAAAVTYTGVHVPSTSAANLLADTTYTWPSTAGNIAVLTAITSGNIPRINNSSGNMDSTYTPVGSGTELFTASGSLGTSSLIVSSPSGSTIADSLIPKPIFGVGVLVGGTVTVATASACAQGANCRYYFTNCGPNSSTAIGTPSLGTVTVGTSFVITSLTAANATAAGDVSTICWRIN